MLFSRLNQERERERDREHNQVKGDHEDCARKGDYCKSPFSIPHVGGDYPHTS